LGLSGRRRILLSDGGEDVVDDSAITLDRPGLDDSGQEIDEDGAQGDELVKARVGLVGIDPGAKHGGGEDRGHGAQGGGKGDGPERSA